MNKFSITLATLTTTALLAFGSPAFASHGGDDGPGDDNSGSDNSGSGGGDDDRVIKTGPCTDGARWKLKVKTDDGRLEVEGEVDTNAAGQTWDWKITDNGAVAAKGTATTGGRSGSFEVERKITNQAGTDTVTFRATRAGQRCVGTIAF